MTDPLKQEKEYLKSHQVKLAEQYPGKYLLIKGDTVHGAFETYEQGVIERSCLVRAIFWFVRSCSQMMLRLQVFPRYL